ncbi:MAG TPA: zf-HC2 domain-containing protein [Candidatus Binatia bacterium]|nr:zf-HC2 domain-containing protein [Candidatus Binatia bacterium]
MTCETIRTHLVAYRDGELPEQERTLVAAHLSGCSACTREEAQLARVHQMLAGLERVTPSPDFAATFWRRLEQEDQSRQEEPESRLVQWWREWRESLSGWQLAPVLVGAASLLVFFGYILSSRPVTTPTSPTQPVPQVAPNVPASLLKQPGLFANYKVITDLDRLSHLDEIAAVQLPGEPDTELASEQDLPPELLKDPDFFVHYPLLQKMEKLENLEAVLDRSAEGDEHGRG